MIGAIRMKMMIGHQKNTETMIGQTSPGLLGMFVVFLGEWGKPGRMV
jgi:hypothetical protein